MKSELLNSIITDILLSDYGKSLIEMKNPALHHFGAGLHIRNKYLWGNEKNIAELKEFFQLHSAAVDDISAKVIEYIIENIAKLFDN